MSIWDGRGSYEPRQGSVVSWLLTTARHRAIDVAHGNTDNVSRQAGGTKLRLLPAHGDVSNNAAAHAETDRMQMLLSRLPDAQREVITLAFYGQLTHTEIAHQLELSSGTVKGRMRLGLHKLRDEW